MTQEEKELLIKDISARLPYGLIVQYKRKTFEPYSEYTADEKVEIDDMLHHRLKVLDCKPYLRPMSSMTEEESEKFEEFLELQAEYTTGADIRFKYDMFDWLNSKHFDYRGLIEKGLAIEAPEGMYD